MAMSSTFSAPKPSGDVDVCILGGTGLYAFDGAEVLERRVMDTPFGAPSDAIDVVQLHGKRVGFLARHGQAHNVAPHHVNYRANIWALHQLGSGRVLALNTVGGITSACAPQSLVLVDQLIDYTHGRVSSFAEGSDHDVIHAEFAEPYSGSLRAKLIEAAKQANLPLLPVGCYAATQGPRLETSAEIKRLKQDGCDVVGMTGMPEAVLAREIGLDYASLCLVANWAAGCDPNDAPITMDEILHHISEAKKQAQSLIGQWLMSH